MANVTFLGACGVVTGSSTLLSWGETQVLIDCGMFQGDEELEQRNRREFRFKPHELTAVILTHAHLDHSGLLPRLVKEGYQGPIYCTKPTRGLVSLILEDSGRLQEEEVRFARRKRYSRHRDPKALYDSKDARKTLRQIAGRPFDQFTDITDGIRFRFRRAGHLLGAASVEVSAKGSDGERRSWCFSGDIGRYDVPILKDPEVPLDEPAAVVLESTYGDRVHDRTDLVGKIHKVVRRVFDRGGILIIPAFALGRTQEVLYHLSELADRNELDPGDVYLDSPMAISATELYDRAVAEHDEELIELARDGGDPLASGRFNRCRAAEASKALNDLRRPAVIVASSGMATGGRVVHHLKRRLPDPKNAVLFVGYQAGGTRGRALVNGAQFVGIHGMNVPVEAEILQIGGLSAHADVEELKRWARSVPGRPERLFLNHGEDPPRRALSTALEDMGWPRAELPVTGDTFPW